MSLGLDPLVRLVLLAVVPGADMALVTRLVLDGGPPIAWETMGSPAGVSVHCVASAVGRR